MYSAGLYDLLRGAAGEVLRLSIMDAVVAAAAVELAAAAAAGDIPLLDPGGGGGGGDASRNAYCDAMRYIWLDVDMYDIYYDSASSSQCSVVQYRCDAAPKSNAVR